MNWTGYGIGRRDGYGAACGVENVYGLVLAVAVGNKFEERRREGDRYMQCILSRV